MAVWLTRRPRQRSQDYTPTGSFLRRLDHEFLQRNIDVDIVELEVKGSLHVGRADEPRRALFSRPTHLSSWRSARVIFRW